MWVVNKKPFLGGFSNLCKDILLLVVCCLSVSSSGQSSLFDPLFSVSSGANGAVNDIVVQGDGKIILGGEFSTISGNSNAFLARLTSNGQFDNSFGTGTDGPVYKLLQQPDGNILVAGNFTVLQGVTRLGIGRLLTNGVVDTNFNAGSLLETNGGGFALAYQADGKVLVGTVNADGGLFRLNQNGQLDSSFTQTNSFQDWWVNAIYPRTNGSILIGGGFTSVNEYPSDGLALLDTNGDLDTNFISPLEIGSTAYSIIGQTNGNLLVAGLLKEAGLSNQMVLIRLATNLVADTNFTADLFDSNPPLDSYITSVLAQPDGKIVVGGNFYNAGGYWRRHVARLDSDGHVDPCFDPGLGLEGFKGARVVVRQPDDRILVGGSFDSTQFGATANIARLLPQSDCDVTRTYLVRTGGDSYYVAGTCAPGGTNYLQSSSNLVDWVDIDVQTQPFCKTNLIFSAAPASFFRVKKLFKP